MTVLDELAHLPNRLTAAAQHVEESRTRYDLAIEQRNRLVIAAVDHGGMSYRDVARAAGVSQPHVVRILSRQDAYADAPAAAAD